MLSLRLPRKRVLLPRRCRQVATVGVLCLTLVAAGCGSTTKSTTASGATSSTSAKGSGPVNVLYAGSLVGLMTKQVGTAFDAATGYTFTGFSGDSGSLATQIKSKVHQGDVFISASPTVNTTLEGPANGNWVSWYATFATSPLVLGYNPNSKFAADIKTKPWYQAITEPNILVGRTDPTTDPKGKLTVQALDNGATADNTPALTALATATNNVYPEATLVGRLQAGQLDAGFFYAAEAKAANFPTVPLTGQALKATYTITVLNNAPDEPAAEAFIKYLLGSGGTVALNGDGFSLVSPPTATGTGVPAGLKSVIPG